MVEAKRLLDCNPGMTVQEAADQLGISRSSFYKYKEDIFPFHDEAKGKTVTFMLQVEDEPGLLSTVLNIIAEFGANILTIHQTIPINGIATLTLSVQVLSTTGDVSAMIEKIEQQQGSQISQNIRQGSKILMIKVAIIGYGTVGSGVYEGVQNKQDQH